MAKQKEETTIGRPTLYSQEVVFSICALLMEGKSLRKICEMPEMPALRTVCQWLADPEKQEFTQQYARAREVQGEIMADEIVDIADTAKGKNDSPAVAIKVDARKWVASKLLPKKYGSFKAIELKGELETKQTDLSHLSFDQLYELRYGRKPE